MSELAALVAGRGRKWSSRGAPDHEERDQHETPAGDLTWRPSGADHFAAGVLASETFWFAVFRSMQPLVSVYEYVPSSSRQNSPWKGQ